METKKGMSRRQFLKTAGLTGLTALLGGCTDPIRTLIPFVRAPEDMVPGEATWYATTCRECPAGCGMLAKTRDGRVIKVEGNPLHPVNEGRLCPRGQASVQGIYNPDRFNGPLKRSGGGKPHPTTWHEAERVISSILTSNSAKTDRKNVVFISDLVTGIERATIRNFLSTLGMERNHLMYEPLAYEALRRANGTIFGIDAVPSYHIDNSDFLVSFTANFLETWVSNVHFARQFSAFRKPENRDKHVFIYAGPRLSVTASNADHWIGVHPGEQSTLAKGMIRMLLEKNYNWPLQKSETAAISSFVSGFTPQVVASRTAIDERTLQTICDAFMRAKSPLVLAEGLGYEDSLPLGTAEASNILCRLGGSVEKTIDFSNRSSLSNAAHAAEMKKLVDNMKAGEVDVVFIMRANPVYSLPYQWSFAEALKSVPLVVSLSSFPDETTELAHIILPINTFLEDWGDYSPWTGIHGFLQPVMGTLFDTRPAVKILKSITHALKGQGVYPSNDPFDILRDSMNRGKASEDGRIQWQKALSRGGLWAKKAGASKAIRFPDLSNGKFAASAVVPDSNVHNLSLVSYPTIQFFDGRTANRPFLQELPDPITAITWDGWIEIHPDAAAKLGMKKGDILKLESDSGSIEAPVYPWPGVQPHTLAMPIGYGGRTFGRFALSRTGNGMHLSSATVDDSDGAIRVSLSLSAVKTGKSMTFAHTDGSTTQFGRDIVRSVSWQVFTSTVRRKPEVIVPLPDGYSAERDFYAPHQHDEYRWSMIVDLDRCIGCGACVVACYAENNVAVVGREQVIKGREMAWLHVQRYYEKSEPFVRFLPMLC
ncbi:MAG TPA: molybdopterin-dependent oxidoreductase, partial [Syntrophorhabdaceae bacterium]|nr:molybdopterin-dependent oxidoreductase [Syntrophorhabdaceae bacterium]